MGACLPCFPSCALHLPPAPATNAKSASSTAIATTGRSTAIIFDQFCRDSDTNSSSIPPSASCSDDDACDRIVLKVSALSGQQLLEVRLAPSRRVEVLKRQVQAACGVWADEQRLVFRDAELAADRTLAASGITRDDSLTMVHVPRSYVLGGKTDGSLTLWDLTSGDCAESLPRAHQRRILSVAVDWPARRAITTCNDRTLIIWDLVRGVPEHIISGLSSSMQQAVVDWEHQRLLGGFSDGSVFLLEFAEEASHPTRRIGCHGKCVTSLAADWSTHRAFTASYDRTAILWDVLAGQSLRVFQGHKGVIMDVALSWSDKLAASGSADGTIALWGLSEQDEGHRLLALRGHSGTVRALAVNWSGRMILSASSDHNLGLWRFEHVSADNVTETVEAEESPAFTSVLWTSSLLAMLQGHHGEVNIVDAKWSDDIAISAANDRTLIIWDLAERVALQVLRISGCAEITAMQVNWDAVDRNSFKA